jgi:hypothetical protein
MKRGARKVLHQARRNSPANYLNDPRTGAGSRPVVSNHATVLSLAPPRAFPIATFGEAVKTSTFWLLGGSVFVCGMMSNGLVGTHMIPHAIERGIAEVTAATAVGIMGVASFIGATFAGWLCDRINARKSCRRPICSACCRYSFCPK